MRTVLFVPGFRQTFVNHDYQAVMNVIKKKGYKVNFIPIEWKNTEFSDWLYQLDREYEKLDATDTILAGFSYGAMIALVAATQTPPSELWLCSLSPYFEEDIDLLKITWLLATGKKRIKEFRKLSFKNLASKVTCKTLLFIGENEAKKYPSMEKRTLEANQQIKNNRLIRIPNCKHDITTPNYVEAIRQAI